MRDPAMDAWDLTHVDPFDGLDVYLNIHTCEEHPSGMRQPLTIQAVFKR